MHIWRTENLKAHLTTQRSPFFYFGNTYFFFFTNFTIHDICDAFYNFTCMILTISASIFMHFPVKMRSQLLVELHIIQDEFSLCISYYLMMALQRKTKHVALNYMTGGSIILLWPPLSTVLLRFKIKSTRITDPSCSTSRCWCSSIIMGVNQTANRSEQHTHSLGNVMAGKHWWWGMKLPRWSASDPRKP